MANKFGELDDADPEKVQGNEGKDTPAPDTPDPKKNDVSQDTPPPENDFWNPPPDNAEKEQQQAMPNDLADALKYVTDLLHHELAVGTGFEGWELDETESRAWAALWGKILPYISFKYMELVLLGVTIAIFEFIKTGKYLKWKRTMAVKQ